MRKTTGCESESWACRAMSGFANQREGPFSTGLVDGENAILFHSYQAGWVQGVFHRLGTSIRFGEGLEGPNHQVFVFVMLSDILDRVEAVWGAKDETLTLTHNELGNFQDHLHEVRVLKFYGYGQGTLKPVEILGAKNNWMRVRKLGV